jgi:hypothetical protein
LNRRKAIPVWAQTSWEKYQTSLDELEKVSDFIAPIQRGQTQGYIVFPEILPEGQYVIIGKNEYTSQDVILQVTDLAAYQATSKTTSLVWVNDVQQKAPLTDATVSIVGTDFSYTTDQSGIAQFETPEILKQASHAYYFDIQKDGHHVVIPITQAYYGDYGHYLNPAFSDWYWWEGRGDDTYWSYLYLDRELFQPTDTINVWGLLRNRDNEIDHPSVTVALYRSWYSPSGSPNLPVASVELSTNDLGTFDGSLSFDNVVPDIYRVELKIGDRTYETTYITIEQFTKPSYTLDISSDKKAVFTDETVTYTGEVTFFEGTPVPNVDISYSGVHEGTTVTDDRGQFSLSYTPAYSADGDYPVTKYLDAHPSLSEEAEIAGRGTVRVFGPRITIDSSIEYPSDTQAQIQATVYGVDLSGINQGTTSDYFGEPVANQKISGEITEYYWEKIENGEYYDFINKKVVKKYDYRRQSQPYGSFTVTTDSQGVATHTFSLIQDRWYEIKLQVTDSGQRTETDRSFAYSRFGRSNPSFNTHETYSLGLITESPEGKATLGETVTTVMHEGIAPLPDTSTPAFLFFPSQRGILTSSVQNSAQFSFEFTDSMTPNAYVYGVYFNGVTYEQATPLNIDFDQTDKQLELEVTPNKPRYAPNEQVTLSISATSPAGLGKIADVNLSVVDEALFALRDQSVSTLNSLFENVSSGVLQTYSSHQYPKDFYASEMGAACFIKGTPVKISQNESVPIESLQAGDSIMTLQHEYAHELVSDTVTGVDTHVVNHILVINEELWVTPEHRFFIDGKWEEIGKAQRGDMVVNDFGQETRIDSIEHKFGEFEVYNLHIADHKTYIAGNYYVHNQKGEGRFNFVDTAFFDTVRTNRNGTATATFTLPDNLTSWRLTYQGVSSDLYAGHGTTNIPVSLPVFVEATLNNEYLLQDKPVVKLRAYGTSLTDGLPVIFKVKIPSLGWEQEQVFQGTAFEETYVTLPALQQGKHQFIVSVESAVGNDTLTKTFSVINSRLTKSSTEFTNLTTNISLPPVTSPVMLTFTDRNRGQYYPSLQNLRWTDGDRVDQVLARALSEGLLNEYFGQNLDPTPFEGSSYQAPDGGIALLPYSGSEPALSAKITALAADEFDREALKNYYILLINKPDASYDEIAPALYGLASLDQPVILALERFRTLPDLTYMHKLYTALGFAALGDFENAFEIYTEILENHGEDADPYIRLNVGQDQDDTLESTSLASLLAATLSDKRAEKMFNYVEDYSTYEILTNIEKLIYLNNAIPDAPDETVSFTYSIDGETTKKELANGASYYVSLTPEQYDNLTFEEVNGNVGLSIHWTEPLDPSGITPSENIHLTKTYTVGGSQLSHNATIKENDLVRVQVDYALEPKAFEGCYQITDYVPSGLTPITKRYGWNIREDVIYPYRLDPEAVRYCVYKNYAKPLVYYARVNSAGTYTSEGTFVQSQDVLNDTFLTPAFIINISAD